VSTLRQERDIAIGNLMGSCVLNVLVILGIPVVLSSTGLAIDPELVRVDIPVMVVAALVCIPVFITGRRVGRLEAMALLLAYIAYMAYLLSARTCRVGPDLGSRARGPTGCHGCVSSP